MDILIVEDDQRQARNIERALLLAGHRTELAPDGAIGLDEALARPFDLILLDLLLPLVDGFAVCRQLRQREVRTPILMLTAATPSVSVSAGSTRALHDYLTKPFATEELLARVRALGRRSRDALDDALRVDDLVLDPARHEVQRGDRYVELTPKAFERQAVLGARCNGHNAGQLRRHVHLPVRVVAPGDHTAVLCQCQTVQSPCSDSCHAGWNRRGLGIESVRTVRRAAHIGWGLGHCRGAVPQSRAAGGR